MLKISLEKIDEMLKALSQIGPIYLPVDGSDKKARFEKWEEGKKWSEALHTERSAKDFFFPQTEDIVKFKTEGKNIEIIDVRDENALKKTRKTHLHYGLL